MAPLLAGSRGSGCEDFPSGGYARQTETREDLGFQGANPLLTDGSEATRIGLLRFVCREGTFLPYGLIPRKPFSIAGRWTILLPVAGVE
jgi:hypothetical protein